MRWLQTIMLIDQNKFPASVDIKAKPLGMIKLDAK